MRSALIRHEARSAVATDLPVRPRGETTPKQRDLLADLLAILRTAALALDATDPDGAANGLRLHTTLVSHAVRWDGDPAVTAMIRHLLAAWAGVGRTRSPAETLRLLRAGQVDAAERLVPAGTPRTAGAGSLAILIGLGEPALAVVERLLQIQANEAGPTQAPRGFETPSAGLFFLLRTILDLRLPWLIRESAYPVADPADALGSAVLLELGLRLAGGAGPDDAGPRLFAGIEQPLPVADYRAGVGADPAADGRFQEILFFRNPGPPASAHR